MQSLGQRESGFEKWWAERPYKEWPEAEAIKKACWEAWEQSFAVANEQFLEFLRSTEYD